jgi:tetratricopeptide (TPR) repeat protein
LWPFGQQEIFTNWYVALKKSTEGAYFTYNHELFEGVRMYMGNVPWYYLPKFIIINTPLSVLAGLGLSLLLIFFWKKSFGKNWILLAFVLFALIFPITYAEYQSMYYYNGWRHYLFIYPSMIVLAALGWETLTRLIPVKVVNTLIAVLIIALCALPATWMLGNTPNECVYFNELVSGTKGAYGNYELDYYSNSCRAAGEWLAQQEPGKKLVVAINNVPQTAAYYASKINPNLEFRWVREYEEQKPDWDYAILTTRTLSKNELQNGSFPPKGTVHVIEAGGAPIAAVVKRENHFMPLGYKAADSRQIDSAIYYFTLAVQDNPKDEEAVRMLGTLYSYRGSADSAILFLEKSIVIFPENYTAYNDLGLVYLNLKHDPNKALECFKKSYSLKYNFTDAYYYAAAVYMNQNDFRSAIPILENSIKRGGSGVPQIYYNLGIAYLNTSSFKKAEEQLINCLSLDPNFLQAYKALAQVFSSTSRPEQAQQCMQRYQQLGGR